MVEAETKRRREPVNHPDRECANPGCRQTFKPIRETQTFHDPACRKAYWREAYHWQPHPCPYCTVVHSPDEAPVLDALEHLIRDDGAYSLIGKDRILLFITRRRAILRGEVGAETPRS